MNTDMLASPELATLVDTSQALEVAGERLELTPLKMRQVPAFQVAITPIVAAMPAVNLQEGFDFGRLQKALLDHVDAAMQAVALMARRDLEWVAELDPDEFLKLAMACFLVNLTFFTDRLVPTYHREMKALYEKIAAGLTLPPGSSAPVTATAT